MQLNCEVTVMASYVIFIFLDVHYCSDGSSPCGDGDKGFCLDRVGNDYSCVCYEGFDGIAQFEGDSCSDCKFLPLSHRVQ